LKVAQEFSVIPAEESDFTAKISWVLEEEVDSCVIERAEVINMQISSFEPMKTLKNYTGRYYNEIFIQNHSPNITYFYRVRNFKNGVASEYSEVKGITFSEEGKDISLSPETIIGNISIYPNPSTDIFYIDNLPKNINFLITDMSGRVINQGITQENMQFDFSTMSKGIYFIHFLVSNEKKSFRLAKQ